MAPITVSFYANHFFFILNYLIFTKLMALNILTTLNTVEYLDLTSSAAS